MMTVIAHLARSSLFTSEVFTPFLQGNRQGELERAVRRRIIAHAPH